MADAKVIRFDDDRSRGASGKGAGRRKGRRKSEPAGDGDVHEIKPLPVQRSEPEPAPFPREPGAAERGGWDRRVAGGLAFLRRRLTGDYEIDEFGYDKELTDHVLMSLLRPLAENYFRVE